VKQKRNCALALNGGDVKKSNAYFEGPYDSSMTFTQAASSNSVFFDNPHVSECGAITSTILLAQGCSSPYTLDNLAIDSSTGEITMKQNTDAGFTETVCV
jgi:hypothetical protein